MPSPATRSNRLATKEKENEKEEKTKAEGDKQENATSDILKGGRATRQQLSKMQSAESKSGKTTQESKQTRQNNKKESTPPKKSATKNEIVPSDDFEKNPPAKASPKMSDIGKDVLEQSASNLSSTPTQSIRRSSRAPVPSSRFKDMEVELTPTSHKLKRSLISSPTTDPPEIVEPSLKKSRRNRSVDKCKELTDDENPIPPVSFENDSKAPLSPPSKEKGQQELEERSNDTVMKPSNENTELVSQVEEDKVEHFETEMNVTEHATVEIPSSDGDKNLDTLRHSDYDDTVEEDLTSEQGEENQLILSEHSGEFSVVGRNGMESLPLVNNVTLESKSVDEESNTVVALDVPVNDKTKTSQQLSNETNEMVMEEMETVDNYVAEDKMVVIQRSEELAASTVSEVIEEEGSSIILPSDIMLKGQEIVVEERDGKMIAIVKVPSSFNNNFNNDAQLDDEQNALTDKTPVLKSMMMQTPPKTKHGYVVNKSNKPTEQTFITVSNQENKSVNISLQPSPITSLLHSNKTDTMATKAHPKTLYGRVIKQEPMSGYIIQNASLKRKEPVAATPPIKGTNPKECKPYSLLSSPMELLQKLKAEAEKRQAAIKQKEEQLKKAASQLEKAAPQLGSPPKKVIIIAHKTKANDEAVKDLHPLSIVTARGNEESKDPGTKLFATKEDEMQSGSSQDIDTDVATKINEMVSSIISGEVEEEGEKQNTGTLGELKEFPKSEQNDNDTTITNLEVPSSSSGEMNMEPVDKEAMTIGEVLLSETDKLALDKESIMPTDTETEVQIKQEVDLETEIIDNEDKALNSATTQKIRLVENGVVYELQIMSQPQIEGSESAEATDVKEETVEIDNEVHYLSGTSTSGTQTFYSSKRGRPKLASDKDGSETSVPVHKLTSIVQEGDQKKHYYFVSMAPGKKQEQFVPGCVVNEDGEYCCQECEYKTDKKANFYKHRRLHTAGSKTHVCTVCQYQARTSSNLKRHMGIHDDIREFKCDQCPLSFRQKIHLERHVRYRHEEKRVKCPMCDYICANEQPDLKMHIKRKHSQDGGKIATCPECSLVVYSKKDLKQHLKFHKDGPELKLFCKECSFVTDCKSRLQRHLVVHSNVKPYHCGVCDYKATQKEHVVRHLRSQHKIEVSKPKRPWKKQVKQESSENLGGNARGDFTCGDKIFACNHCTMRFAKLINLYKHLHTQHSDIMPAESDNYYCVVCEFSTSSKKNLLVHMRRHNMTDQTPPSHVYSCVLCRYVNPRRRNLFQHMRKKHNIDISTQVDIAEMTEEEASIRQDGDKMIELIQTEPTIFTSTNSEEIIETVDSSNGQVLKDNLGGVANLIKIQDLTRVSTSGESKEDTETSVIIDNGDGTQLIQAASLMQHKAADAIEGLQALAGQTGLVIDEEVSTVDTKLMEQECSQTITTTETQVFVEEQVATIDEPSSTEQIQQIVETVESEVSGDGSEGMTSVELTEEQLSSLQHGDIVQMEGNVFMVEVTPDPDSPDKQLLSFLPISQE